jgi:hypothetical protein
MENRSGIPELHQKNATNAPLIFKTGSLDKCGTSPMEIVRVVQGKFKKPDKNKPLVTD